MLICSGFTPLGFRVSGFVGQGFGGKGPERFGA